MTEQWEEIDVPRGAFISWGDRPGQSVTGKVLDYTLSGGTDFDGNPCRQISLELVESAVSVNKFGERTSFDAGELVTLNIGLANLKRGIRAADPARGDLIKITLADLAKLSKGTAKVFEIKMRRGAGAAATSAAARQDDEPPF